MPHQRYLATSLFTLKPSLLRMPASVYAARFSTSSLLRDDSPHQSYTVDEMSRFLDSKSPKVTSSKSKLGRCSKLSRILQHMFRVSVRQPNEVSKQGDAAVGYRVTAEAIRSSMKHIEDSHSDRFLVKNPDELVYMTKTNVKPKFEEALQTLTNQKPDVGMEPEMEWSAEDEAINKTSNKSGSQPIS
ncbi:hypothetical protein K493DRAFT_87829 [Basidiobolus meristosporus CBS 931.73]|uniref:Uncharacterized protein n=1 Tax=Basidiobolus meristosporus CBS 931.73 TaxID=1314790 RepID=A0A1Y1YWD7_9FUNG|nr:hypothetical protein K493DRAFT_87829 [Basidiobolus meristosporus CBS 931.73]|eukprot:ORY02017.1 hypothetical protein K493DRAFT_87829 [Basidiobolus meristosporus CBS 931.73]